MLTSALANARCGRCGDRDVALVSPGTYRCRTCGVLPADVLTTQWRGIRRRAFRLLTIVAVVVGVEAGIAVVLAFLGHPYIEILATMLVLTGASLLVFGGIPGAATQYYSGGSSYRDEVARRFSESAEPASRTFILLGLALALVGLGLIFGLR